MMSKSVILVCAIAAVLGSKLTFKDGSGTCEMVKVGNKITVVDCDLALHNSQYDTVAEALNKVSDHESRLGDLESSGDIASISNQVQAMEGLLHYMKVPCTNTPNAAAGVSFAPLDGKLTGEIATLSCSTAGYKPAESVM
jgi:hypothetical protein